MCIIPWGVDAHFGAPAMRTRCEGPSLAAATSCACASRPAGAARAARAVEGSDPPVRGPGTGAGLCAFSHAQSHPLGVAPLQLSLREGGSSAASKRRNTRSLTACRGAASSSRCGPARFARRVLRSDPIGPTIRSCLTLTCMFPVSDSKHPARLRRAEVSSPKGKGRHP